MPRSAPTSAAAVDTPSTAVVRRSPIPPEQCTLAHSFELIGDRWTLLILRSAMYGVRRFEDFRAELNIPRTILSRRLAHLVEHGLMERRAYREPGQRARAEYPLTDKGVALRVPFLAMWEWGSRWVRDTRSHEVAFRNRDNDRKIRVALVDERGEVVDPSRLKAEFVKTRKP